MKRIKCDSCAGKWMVENEDLEKLTVCPYCGVSIQGEVEFTDYDTLDKAIYGAIAKMGKTVLSNPRQLSGFMMDTAPGLKKEIRIFSKTVTEDYITHIKNAFDEDVDAVENTINKLHHLFVEEEGLSDNWADMLCTGLYGAILYSKGIGTTRICNVEISDYTITTSEKQDTLDNQGTIGNSIRSKTVNKYESVNEISYDILKHYKCSICGFIIDGYDLEHGDSKECPVCSANRWKETDEQTQDYEEKTQVHPFYQKPQNSYDSDACRSLLETAERCRSDNRLDDALEQYRKAANYGYVPAYNSIAEIYYLKRNYKKAWKWYLKSAEANDSIGQYYVGFFYQEGLHVPKNEHLAVKYYEKSAGQGLMQAVLAIADCYKLGTGYKKDVKKSMEHLKLAADSGYAEAQYRMGLYFQNGECGQRDVFQAAYWYQKANLQGHVRAKTKLDECIANMPLTQRVKWTLQKNREI